MIIRSVNRVGFPVIRKTAGIQAQLLSAARLSLWARSANVCVPGINNALLMARSITKSWAMRGTLHLLPSSELQDYSNLILPLTLRWERDWCHKRGVGADEYGIYTALILEALSDGPLTRRELLEKLVGAPSILTESVAHGWGGIMKLLSMRGLVCFGPFDTKRTTLVKVSDWVECSSHGNEGTNDIVRKYISSYGPVTVGDFAYWTGLHIAEAREIWKEVEDELLMVSFLGKNSFILRDDFETIDRIEPVKKVNLLPSFDVFLLGHREKLLLVDDNRYSLVYRKAGWISPVVLRDGRVFATWSVKSGSVNSAITVNLFDHHTDWLKKDLADEIELLGKYLSRNIVAEYTFCE